MNLAPDDPRRFPPTWFILGLFLLQVAVLSALLIVLGSRIANGQTPPDPLGVKPTAAMILLGRELFNDPILSADNTVSCKSCHDSTKGWSDGLPRAVGIRGQVGPLHTPTILNAAYSPLQFWNGRTVGTATQALLPLQNPIEMGGPGNEALAVQELAAQQKYVKLFADAFGTAPTAQGMGLAIAAFETTIVTTDVLANQRLAGKMVLTDDAEVGFKIFQAANCMRCHSGELFTDLGFHNTDVAHARGDLGRQAITGRLADSRKWKTPSLIAVSSSAPYFHDGRAATLRDVLHRYNVGNLSINGRTVTRPQYDKWKQDVAKGIRRDDVRRDVNSEIVPLDLAEPQLDYLLRFLKEGFAPMEMPK